MQVFKLKSEVCGNHIKVTVFSGRQGQQLQNTGHLMLNVPEWQMLPTLILLGADIANTNYKRVCIEIEGDKESISKLFNGTVFTSDIKISNVYH